MISFSHVLSLICYCDLSDFSRAWSESFRFIKFGEGIKEIKERNQKYYWSSKYLIEMVECFGISDNWLYNPNGNESGPYYCGLNRVLTFPSYITRFCGPCSTSTQLSVATRFAKGDGLILTVNNYDVNLHFFNCSWISRYREEEERLFISGTNTIKIENITIIENGKKYTKLVKVLRGLDDIITGIDYLYYRSLCSSEIAYLKELLSFLSFGDNSDYVSDKYIQSLLITYQHHKTQIVINLDFLYGKVSPDLLDIILYGLERAYREPSGKTNIVKISPLLSIFKSLKKLIIYTTSQLVGINIDLMIIIFIELYNYISLLFT